MENAKSSDNKTPKKEMGFVEQAVRATWAGGPMFLFMLVLLPFLVLGRIVAAAPRMFIFASLGLMIAGFVMFSIARVSLYRQGHWLTFGSSLMTPRNRMLYRWGYRLMICSAIISIIIVVISKMGNHVTFHL